MPRECLFLVSTDQTFNRKAVKIGQKRFVRIHRNL